MSVLVVAEHVRGELRPVTLELISAATSLGGPVEVALIARDPSAFTEAVNVEGVDEILAVRVDADEFENDVYQNAVEQLVAERSPEVVLLGFTVSAMGQQVASRLQVFDNRVHAEVDLPPMLALFASKVREKLAEKGIKLLK